MYVTVTNFEKINRLKNTERVWVRVVDYTACVRFQGFHFIFMSTSG